MKLLVQWHEFINVSPGSYHFDQKLIWQHWFLATTIKAGTLSMTSRSDATKEQIINLTHLIVLIQSSS